MRLTKLLACEIIPQYYKHSLNASDILIVDNREKLKFFLSHFETNKKPDVIGLDCEWNSILFNGESESPLSILQISTRKKVFFIDFTTLSEVINNEFSERITQHVLLAPYITKLGFTLRLTLNYGVLNLFFY